MHYFRDLLSEEDLRMLQKSVLDAYMPGANQLKLPSDGAVDDVRRLVEERLRIQLRYFASFFFLVSDTTIETATNNFGDGWHTDNTCQFVDGDCYNVWIPLYNSSDYTGLEVAHESENEWLYSNFDKRLPLNVLVRDRATEIFGKLAKLDDEDLMLLQSDGSSTLVGHWKDVVVARYDLPRAGDLAIFKQSELHRGYHKGGIRLQLSIKFVEPSAKTKPIASEDSAKRLSKHGRLESQLVQELLSNCISISGYGRT